jgi:hypothetical protein
MVAGAAALLLTACGVPAQNEPHRVELPRRALTAPPPTAANTVPTGDVAEVLCLIRDGRLVQTVRRAKAVSPPQGQLDQLVAGPSAAEQSHRLSTALAGAVLTVDLPISVTRATVQVSEAEEGFARSDDVLAYGQIVCTLTSRADISAVSFRRDGKPLQVPRADGTLSTGPLNVVDYRSLIGPA